MPSRRAPTFSLSKSSDVFCCASINVRSRSSFSIALFRCCCSSFKIASSIFPSFMHHGHIRRSRSVLPFRDPQRLPSVFDRLVPRREGTDQIVVVHHIQIPVPIAFHLGELDVPVRICRSPAETIDAFHFPSISGRSAYADEAPQLKY